MGRCCGCSSSTAMSLVFRTLLHNVHLHIVFPPHSQTPSHPPAWWIYAYHSSVQLLFIPPHYVTTPQHYSLLQNMLWCWHDNKSPQHAFLQLLLYLCNLYRPSDTSMYFLSGHFVSLNTSTSSYSSRLLRSSSTNTSSLVDIWNCVHHGRSHQISTLAVYWYLHYFYRWLCAVWPAVMMSL